MKLKVLVCACVALVFSQTSFGQLKVAENAEYFPQGTVWSYHRTTNFVVHPYRYIVDGETAIAGKSYKAVYLFDECEYKKGNAQLAGYIREEGKKIYMPDMEFKDSPNLELLPKEGNEYVLYDFALGIGDKFGTYEDEIKDISTITTADGVERKLFTDNRYNSWIEGIGITNRLFFDPLGETPTCIGCDDGNLEVFNNKDGWTIYRALYTELMTNEADCFFNPKDKKAFYSYQPIVKNTDECKWVYTGLSGNEKYYYKKFISTEDSIINSKTYNKVYKSSCDNTSKEYLGLIREQDKRVYYRADKENEEQLLYDFNLKAGDKMNYQYYGHNSEFEVVRIDTIESKKVMRRQYTFKISGSENEYFETWIEGIGNDYDLLTPLAPRPSMIGAPRVACVHCKDLVLYPSDAETCTCQASSIGKEEIVKTFRILQNPVIDKVLSIELSESGFTGLNLYDYEGKLCLSYPINQSFGSLSISLSHLPKGNYVLILNKEDRVRESAKIRIE